MRAESTAETVYQAVMPSPLPHTPYLGLRLQAGHLTAIDFLRGSVRTEPGHGEHRNTVIMLQDYFSGERVDTTRRLLRPAGTEFQQRVWQRLLQIPPGKIATYGELARDLASSPRAVAGACRANPIPVLIPCHRVVSSSGPGGYMGRTAGPMLEIKQWLLQHEGYV